MRKIGVLFLCVMLVSSSIFVMFDFSEVVEGTGNPEDLSDEDWNAINGLIKEAQYHLTKHDPSKGFVGSNSKCGFGMIFNESGVSISPNTENGWSWDIGLSGFGYSGQVSPITAKPQLSVDKNHINYEYSPQLTEWYINDERGVEQGFTIESPPQLRINAPLVIEMTLETSLTPRAIDNGESIGFYDNSGEHILTYRDLVVIDALGQDVSAWLSLSEASKMSIHIDDTSAAYPLKIDPLITTEVKKLTASDGAATDMFGYSVSISGDTIAVGARYDDIGGNMSQGSAYVFERNNGGADNWGEVKKLTASDGVAGDYFGNPVSVFDDILVVGACVNDAGSAYVFERNNGGADNWGEVKKLTASDGVAGDCFGSVSIFADTIVIGASCDDVGANNSQGSAYVFERNTGGMDNWGQVTKLTASDGAADDYFGDSVYISSDTIVVSADGDDIGANSNQGSAYVFERNQGGADIWGQVTKLTASDGAGGDCFGWSVSIFDDTIVIGANADDVGANNNQGSAYVFERNTGGADNWGDVKKLTASDGAGGDCFGWSVSIFGETIVVGACFDSVGANSGQGSAYVFERNTGGADNWGQVTHITALDGVANDWLGWSVSISSNTIVVSADSDDVGANINQGSAYIFVRSGDAWVEISHPIASDGAADDEFGRSVSIFGDALVVGARLDDVGANNVQGSAYVFERNTGGADNWGQVTKLTASDGAANDYFGRSVSIFGDTIVIGANFDDIGTNSHQGSAYVFERNTGGADNWGQVTKLTASDGAGGDYFGDSVSISGDVLVVGAHGDNVSANNQQGSAYVFERNTGGADNWGQVTKLTASDGARSDWFGSSVSISGDVLVVGANGDNVSANNQQGSAYVFERNMGGADNWGQVTKLIASDGATLDLFGYSVSISGDVLVVGAVLDVVGANSYQGSAYIFERNIGGVDNWGQVTKLTASDGTASGGFGVSVSLSGDVLVVGASDDVGANINQGSAYVFERNQGGADNWGQVTKLTTSDGAAWDYFGWSVSLSGDMLVVGTWGDDVSTNSDQGSAYVFKLTASYYPDFTLSSDDISFHIDDPSNPQNVTIKANILNDGFGTYDVKVRFRAENKSTGFVEDIGENLVTIHRFSTNTTSISHTFTSTLYNIFVDIDPYYEITESNETNNNASKNLDMSLVFDAPFATVDYGGQVYYVYVDVGGDPDVRRNADQGYASNQEWFVDDILRVSVVKDRSSLDVITDSGIISQVLWEMVREVGTAYWGYTYPDVVLTRSSIDSDSFLDAMQHLSISKWLPDLMPQAEDQEMVTAHVILDAMHHDTAERNIFLTILTAGLAGVEVRSGFNDAASWTSKLNAYNNKMSNIMNTVIIESDGSMNQHYIEGMMSHYQRSSAKFMWEDSPFKILTGELTSRAKSMAKHGIDKIYVRDVLDDEQETELEIYHRLVITKRVMSSFIDDPDDSTLKALDYAIKLQDIRTRDAMQYYEFLKMTQGMAAKIADSMITDFAQDLMSQAIIHYAPDIASQLTNIGLGPVGAMMLGAKIGLTVANVDIMKDYNTKCMIAASLATNVFDTPSYIVQTQSLMDDLGNYAIESLKRDLLGYAMYNAGTAKGQYLLGYGEILYERLAWHPLTSWVEQTTPSEFRQLGKAYYDKSDNNTHHGSLEVFSKLASRYSWPDGVSKSGYDLVIPVPSPDVSYKRVTAQLFGGGLWEGAWGNATLIKVDNRQYVLTDLYHIQHGPPLVSLNTLINPVSSLMANAFQTENSVLQQIEHESWLEVDIDHTTGTINRPSLSTDSWNSPANLADGLYNDPWILDATGVDIEYVTMKYDYNDFLNPIHGQIIFDFTGISWTGKSSGASILSQEPVSTVFGAGPPISSNIFTQNEDGLGENDTALFNVTVLSGADYSRAFVETVVRDSTGSAVARYDVITNLTSGLEQNFTFRFVANNSDTYSFTSYLMNESLEIMNATMIGGIALESFTGASVPVSVFENLTATFTDPNQTIRWNISRDIGSETMNVTGIIWDNVGNFTTSFNISQLVINTSANSAEYNVSLPDGLYQCILSLTDSNSTVVSTAQVSLLVNMSIDRFFNRSGITETQVDNDTDSLIDTLDIQIPISPPKDGNFSIRGELRDSAGLIVVSAWNDTYLDQGTGNVSLSFNGTILAVNHPGGSLWLNVNVIDENETTIESVSSLYQTLEYDSSDFEHPGMIVEAWQWDSAIDFNSNTLADVLRVSLEVNVTEVGNYSISGELFVNETSIDLMTNFTTLSAGLQSVYLDFLGSSINRTGFDGPYRVEVQAVSGENNSAWALDNSYNTAPYLANNFEPPEASFTGSFTEIVFDSDGDSKYNQLNLTVGLVIAAIDNYTISATLVTPEGEFVEQVETELNLSVGGHNVQLNFSGEAVYRSWANGTFNVTNLTLRNSSGTMLDFDANPWTTAYYDFDDYDPPRVMFFDSFTQWLQDNDSDGIYDRIIVNCTANITESNWYLMRGFLYHSNGSYMGAATFSNNFAVGVQNFSLQFDGIFYENERLMLRYIEAFNNSLDLLAINPTDYTFYTNTTTLPFEISLIEGWNLISLPLIQNHESIDRVLNSIDGKWDYIQIYNATDPYHWKSNHTTRPDQLDDLDSLTHYHAIWLHTTQACTLDVWGTTPSTTNIPLYAGWNLVSYPTQTQKTVGTALWGTSADIVEIFDAASPYQIKEVGPSYVMKPGEGYWIHVVADCIWIVDW